MKIQFVLLGAALSAALALPPMMSTDCIANCTCVNFLENIINVNDCQGPLIINSTVFAHINKKKIETIVLSNVVINEIQEDAFKGFEKSGNLKIIIENAHIGSVDEKAFDYVEKLRFANCAFEDSPSLSSEKLKELHFGDCALNEIPPLEHLFSLTFLNLSGNYIREVKFDAFAEVFNLEALILSNNEITRIPPTAFVNTEELNSLYLDNNPIKSFNLNVSDNLETLSLKNCYLSSFEVQSSQRLTSVTELYLNGNRLTSLQIQPMKELSVLDLSDNNITHLDDDVFSYNTKLYKVTLDNNKFVQLPNFTGHNDSGLPISQLSCKNCGLRTVHPATFKYMQSLQSLILSYNNLTSVDGMFDYAKSLETLDISFNKIKNLTNAFTNNRNLENLNVAGNALMVLNPEDFAYNKALGKLNAQKCELYEIWSNNLTTLESLKQLFVANNQITYLTPEYFTITPNLRFIDINNNPIDYEDKTCNTLIYLQNHFVYLIRAPIEDASDIGIGYPSNWNDSINKCSEMELVEDVDERKWLFHDNEDDPKYQYEDDIDDDDDDYYDDDYDNLTPVVGPEAEEPTAEVIEGDNMNLARISYVLSITSVFVLTALAVLIMAVIIALCIFRRNNTFNMHKANLPRLKIPLWDTQSSEKKHSGSVYRPLSEDLSGPKTPKMSRYEFAATPTVHTSNP